jgi:transposase-like protein
LWIVLGSSSKASQHKGLSCSKAKDKIGEWVQQFQVVQDWIATTPKKKRKIVALDETKIKVNGDEAFIWGAIDVENKEILALEVSWLRNGAHAIWFLQDTMKRCTYYRKTLFITDGAGWYPWACRILRLRHKIVHGGKRNKIERWWRTFKEWARRFYKNFIVRQGILLEKVKQRISLWAGLWYNNFLLDPT